MRRMVGAVALVAVVLSCLVSPARADRIDDLIDKLGGLSFDNKPQKHASDELAEIGAPAVPRVIQALRSSKSSKRTKRYAVRVFRQMRIRATRDPSLGDLGAEAASELIALMKSSDDRDTRDFAAFALGRMPTKHALARPALERIARFDPDSDVRKTATRSLQLLEEAVAKLPPPPAPRPTNTPQPVPTPAPNVTPAPMTAKDADEIEARLQDMTEDLSSMRTQLENAVAKSTDLETRLFELSAKYEKLEARNRDLEARLTALANAEPAPPKPVTPTTTTPAPVTPTKTPPVKTPAATFERPADAVVVDAAYLIDAFKKNEVNAGEEYLNRDLAVRGTVSKVTTEDLPAAGGGFAKQINVRFLGENDLFRGIDVRFPVDSPQREQLLNLKQGDSVTAYGNATRYRFGQLEMSGVGVDRQ